MFRQTTQAMISKVIRQKGKSQNGCYKKTKYAKCSKKRTFPTLWYTHVRIFGVLCFFVTPVLRFAFLPYYWWYTGFELVKLNRFAKKSECCKEKGPEKICKSFYEKCEEFCEPIWTKMYYESLWNHVVIQQGVFNRLKITYYIASSMNNSENSWSIWF